MMIQHDKANKLYFFILLLKKNANLIMIVNCKNFAMKLVKCM